MHAFPVEYIFQFHESHLQASIVVNSEDAFIRNTCLHVVNITVGNGISNIVSDRNSPLERHQVPSV